MTLWDATKPASNDSLADSDDLIRANWDALQTAIGQDHDFDGTTQSGKHERVTLMAPITTPASVAADHGVIYTKDVSSKAELHFIDEDENEVQLTSGGSINLDSASWSSAPALPDGTTLAAATETSDGDRTVADKAYVDARLPSGSITMYGGNSAPTGWLKCDGSAISRSTYSDLFSAIGTSFGVGDGSTTFNLPDLSGRIPVGVGTGTDDNAVDDTFTLGGEEGEYEHTLTEAEMPEHNHTLRFNSGSGTGDTYPGGSLASYNKTLNTLNAGSGNAHNNIQPVIGLNFIIKY